MTINWEKISQAIKRTVWGKWVSTFYGKKDYIFCYKIWTLWSWYINETFQNKLAPRTVT